MAIHPYSKQRYPGGPYREYFGDGPPTLSTDGTYRQGDIVWNTAPSGANDIGWVCVASGSPGTWTGFGQGIPGPTGYTGYTGYTGP